MLEGFDDSTPHGPTIENELFRSMFLSVFDAGLQILPFAVTKMGQAVRTGWCAFVVAIRNVENRQSKFGEHVKVAQTVAEGVTIAMYNNDPGVELARHIPGRHI